MFFLLLPIVAAGAVALQYPRYSRKTEAKQDLKPAFYDHYIPENLITYKGKTYRLYVNFIKGIDENKAGELTFEDFIAHKFTDLSKPTVESTFFCVYRKVVNNEVVEYENYGFIPLNEFRAICQKYSSRSGWQPVTPLPESRDEDGELMVLQLIDN